MNGSFQISSRQSAAKFWPQIFAILLLFWLAIPAALALTNAPASNVSGYIQLAQLANTATARAPAQKPLPERLKSLEQQIEKLNAALKQKDASDRQLQDLQPKLDPLRSEAQGVKDALESERKAAKARLDQLGNEPKKGAPAEAPAVAGQRLKLKTAFDQADSLFKRAGVAFVRLGQLNGEITNKRRAILQSVLLKRSRSALHPLFWHDVARDFPETMQGTGRVFGNWFSQAGGQLNKGNWLAFILFLIVLGAIGLLLWNVARRVLPRRETQKPGEFEKVIAALWVAAVVFAVPVVIAMGLLEGLRYFNLVPLVIEPLAVGLVKAVQHIALTAGLARGIFAPAKSEWRMINIDSMRARRLARLAVQVIAIIEAMRVVGILFNMTAASLVMSQALIVVGSLGVAIVIAATLYGTAIVAAKLDAELGPILEPQQSAIGLWRSLIWIAVLVIFAANILGYINIADFALAQIVRVMLIGITAFLLIRLMKSGLAKMFAPNSFLSNLGLTTFGLRNSALQQISIVLSGALLLLIYIATGGALLAPLGVETVTVASTLNALFFGFDIGGVRISLATGLIAVGLLVGGYVAAKGFQGWLDRSYLPSTDLDSGLQNSISTSAKYLGIIAAIALSLGYLGLNFEKLAFVAGALSLGIGFGLQAIVSNFVSGLILLWERSIKVGDWVVVGSDEGHVRRINVRSTEIETFDRQMVILPNSSLMTGVVKNWVRNNHTGRISVPVGVSYNSNPDQVREILLSCAKTHDLVMDQPGPYVVFQGFGDSSLDFELRVYLSNVESSLTVRSHLRFEIFRRFKEQGIEIPFPQRDLNLRDFDKIKELVEMKKAATERDQDDKA